SANSEQTRNAMLNAFVDVLNFSGQKRVDLMIESYRQTGEVPGSFVTDQAAQLWVLRTPKWREDLLAEIVAAPARHGAPALLLMLGRETRHAPAGSKWRKTWDASLQTLERHPQASADLKAMIPVAREVAQFQ